MQDDFDDELMFLSGGVQSEKERVERLTLKESFILLKFTVDKIEKERQKNKQ